MNTIASCQVHDHAHSCTRGSEVEIGCGGVKKLSHASDPFYVHT